MTDEGPGAGRAEDASGQHRAPETRELPPWILDLLACPVDRSAVQLDGSDLVCARCGRRYPVVSGVPRMIPDQPG
jgi:uncharacterized protein